MVRLRGAGTRPLHQQGPSHLLDVSRFWRSGATYFLGVAEWLFGGLLFLGFWNRKLGILGALGFMLFVCCNHHHHPIHTERLGSLCWRVSSDDRDRCFSFEGSRSLGCIRVSAAAGMF